MLSGGSSGVKVTLLPTEGFGLVCAANFNYGGGNPMRPHRVRLTHSLVKNYGLNKRLLVHRPQPRSDDELEMFHADGALT